MEHLINKNNISTLARPISGNIDSSRVDSYIGEAEMSQIKPTIGDAFFIDLISSDEPSDVYKLLLDGGRYINADGSLKLFGGLRRALAYYAYAKIVKNNPVNVTSFGTMFKDNEHSQSIDYKQIIRIHDDAVEYGNQVMTEVLDFLKDQADKYPLFIAQAKTPAQKSLKVIVKSIGQ